MERLFDTVLLFGMVVFCASLSEGSSGLASGNTLTTAKVYGISLPKPSSFYRKSNVQLFMEFSSTPLNLFANADLGRRQFDDDDLWKWDAWCQLQPKTGDCSEKYLRYYYNAQLDTCLPFSFSGCDANKNNFQTLVECERYCKGSNYNTIRVSSRSSYCGLQPNVGLCMELLPRYFYDVNTKECKRFLYGGCGGNQNRFKTKLLCTEKCHNI